MPGVFSKGDWRKMTERYALRLVPPHWWLSDRTGYDRVLAERDRPLIAHHRETTTVGALERDSRRCPATSPDFRAVPTACADPGAESTLVELKRMRHGYNIRDCSKFRGKFGFPS
jgi:hypothetical protein